MKKQNKAKPGRKADKVLTSCLLCGKQFETHRCLINRGNGKFCSRECYYSYKRGY